jgi:hypothetical protein
VTLPLYTVLKLNLADPKLEPGRIKEKTRKKKPGVIRLTRWVDPARPGKKPDCNPLTYVYFLLK